jgi:hypothetical protein
MIALAALTLALAQDAAASSPPTPFDYSYVDVRFDYFDFDGLDDGETGFTLGGSYVVYPQVFVLGEYQRLTEDADSDTFALGAGFFMPFASRTDFTGDAAWLHQEINLAGVADDDDDGIRLRAGVRQLLSEPLEVNAYLIHLNVDSDADTGVRLGGQYRWNDALSFVGSYSRFDDDSDLFDVGIRLDF